MHLMINGEPHNHTGDGTLVSLLAELRVDSDRVATMVNDEIVPKDKRANAKLNEGDRIEVLIFAGGG